MTKYASSRVSLIARMMNSLQSFQRDVCEYERQWTVGCSFSNFVIDNDIYYSI